MAVSVMNESQREVKPPVRWIRANAFFDQGRRLVRLPSTVGLLLAKEYRAGVICDDQVRIQVSGDVQQWRQQLIVCRASNVLGAKILDCASPVNICQQAGIAKAKLLDGFA